MTSETVSIDGLADAIVTSVEHYTDSVVAGIPAVLDAAAKETLTDLRNRSPRKTGSYAKGWRVKRGRSGTGGESRVIHNATDYQLTHLLELGHAKRNGGRVSAIPHIALVAEAHGAKFSADLARLVVQGGRR